MRSILGFCLISLSQASALSLDDYLKEVESKFESLKAQDLSTEGARLRADEASLVVLPQLRAEGSYLSDDLARTTLPYSTYKQWRGKAELIERTPIGVDLNLVAGYDRQNLTNFASSPYTYLYSEVQASLPLWRNLLGKEVRALHTQIKAAALASSSFEDFKKRQILASAETAYWRLKLSKEITRLAKDAFERADKLYRWNKKKAAVDLVNESALSQSEANIYRRRAFLEAMQVQEKLALRSFNFYRQADESDLPDLSDIPTSESILALKIEGADRRRKDFVAEIQRQDFSIAQAELGRQKNLPDFKVFGSYRTQGQASTGESRPAIDSASDFKSPLYTIGVGVSVPLAFFSLYNSQKGYAYEVESAQIRKRQLEIESTKAWKDFLDQFESAKNRYEYRRKTELAEGRRRGSEQKLFERGRTSTFQLILAEQDFVDAGSQGFETMLEVLGYYAQRRLFE